MQRNDPPTRSGERSSYAQISSSGEYFGQRFNVRMDGLPALCCIMCSLRCCCWSACLGILWVVVVVWQGIAYGFVTAGCGLLKTGKHYAYPGGGTSEAGGPEFNLIPERALLIEGVADLWGWPFDLMLANNDGRVSGSQVGTFWRNWGPLWYTYSYQDVLNSQLTMYMRRNVWMPWQSYQIRRCDGQGPTYTFTDYGHSFGNWWQEVWQVSQGMTYSIYADEDEIASVRKMTHAYSSYVVVDPSTHKFLGSAILDTKSFTDPTKRSGMQWLQWYINSGRDDTRRLDSEPSGRNAIASDDDHDDDVMKALRLVDKVFADSSQGSSKEGSGSSVEVTSEKPTSGPATTMISLSSTTTTPLIIAPNTTSEIAGANSSLQKSDGDGIPYFLIVSILLPDAYAKATSWMSSSFGKSSSLGAISSVASSSSSSGD